MSSSLFNILNKNRQSIDPVTELVSEARKMKQMFTGDPKQTVQQLLNSGQMSQTQFNEYAQIANQIINTGVFK